MKLTRRLLFQELLAFAGSSAFAATTVKTTLIQSSWTDLGVGPLLLRFNGDGVYAIGDTTPTIPPGEGFAIRAGRSIKVMTTSHVWATPRGTASVSAYVAPITPTGGASHSVWSAADAALNGAFTLSNGGLTATHATGTWETIRNTVSHTTGKLYVEFLANTVNAADQYVMIGVADAGFSSFDFLGDNPHSAGIQPASGNHVSVGFTGMYTAAGPVVAADVWGLAIDFTAGNIWIARNNVWSNSSNPATGALPIVTFVPATVGALFAALSMFDLDQWTLQPTAASQKYAPPSGFTAWG